MSDKKKALNNESNLNPNNIISEKAINILQNEFENQNIFVCYDSEKRPCLPSKYGMADTTNPNTWGTLKQALFITTLKDSYKGVGIVFTDTDKGRLCGIDIDKCIDKNGNIAPEALEIINTIDSYSEISINGRGIHILFYAHKKGNICKNNNLKWCKCIEMYDKSHYFTLSGNIINDKGIMYRQNACDTIYDKYFSNAECKLNTTKEPKKKLFTDKQIKDYKEHFQFALSVDETLRKYYNGIRPTKDESSNDLGFCSKLAHWLNDYGLIKEYFLNSPYFMLKDQKHKDKCLKRDDYLKRTIERALKGAKNE